MVMCSTMTLPEHMRFCLTAPLPTSVWVGDEQIVYTNEAFAQFLGAELHDAVLGRPAREGFGELWPVLEPLALRAPTVAEGVKLALPRGDVFATIALSRSSEGIVCTFIDTTEAVRTRRMISSLSHDLRAPLAPIVTTLGVMRLRGESEYVEALEGPVSHMTNLLDRLIEPARRPVEPARAPAPPPLEAARPKSRKRVLLVEDHDDTARSLRTALEVLGYEVAVAHDGPVALTVARAFHPDVALLDIGLPVMDGYELADRLRALRVATRELHVVAVTAHGAEAYIRRSQAAGFAEHRVKPVDLDRLERVVESLD